MRPAGLYHDTAKPYTSIPASGKRSHTAACAQARLQCEMSPCEVNSPVRQRTQVRRSGGAAQGKARGRTHTPQVKSMVRGQSVCEHTLTQRAANSARALDSTLARRVGWAGRGGGPPRPAWQPSHPGHALVHLQPACTARRRERRETSKTTEPALTAPALRSAAARAAPLAGSLHTGTHRAFVSLRTTARPSTSRTPAAAGPALKQTETLEAPLLSRPCA